MQDALRVQPYGLQWSSFIRLLECAWWSRVWVVQEFALARAATLFWGNEEIDWADMGAAIHDLRNMNPSIPRNVFPPSFFDPIAHLSAFRVDGDPMGQADLSILETMMLARPLHCSDSRDRIYGLLGLDAIREARPKGSALAAVIVPDYNKTAMQVYWEVAILAFKLGLTRDMFKAVQHAPTLESWHEGSLPSWVPRWDLNYTQDFPILPAYEELKRTNLGALKQKDGEPPLDATSHHPVGPDKASLRVPGAMIDRIAAVSDCLYDGKSDFTFDAVIDFWTRHLHPFMTRNSSQDPNTELCKALTFYFPSNHPIGVCVAHFEHDHALRSRSYEQYNATIMLDSLRGTLVDAERKHGRLENPVHALWIFRTAMSDALRFTRLFLTDEGRIGLCSNTARTGDCVALVCDAGCPMLLRPQDVFYRLVGGSYVPSLTTKPALRQACDNAVVRTLEIR
jgi:hypothetical protein